MVRSDRIQDSHWRVWIMSSCVLVAALERFEVFGKVFTMLFQLLDMTQSLCKEATCALCWLWTIAFNAAFLEFHQFSSRSMLLRLSSVCLEGFGEVFTVTMEVLAVFGSEVVGERIADLAFLELYSPDSVLLLKRLPCESEVGSVRPDLRLVA